MSCKRPLHTPIENFNTGKCCYLQPVSNARGFIRGNVILFYFLRKLPGSLIRSLLSESQIARVTVGHFGSTASSCR